MLTIDHDRLCENHRRTTATAHAADEFHAAAAAHQRAVNTPDALVVGGTYIRLNGPDGRAICRANLTIAGHWDVKRIDGEWNVCTEAEARAYMEAQSIAYALTH